MIIKSVTLPLPLAEAFALFTEKIDDWWPADRRHAADAASRIMLLESGRFYERTGNLREVELGKVRVWDCPNRLLLDFFVATGPDRPTEVEITFTAQPGGTQVTVLHRPKPESEELWAGRARRYDRSWDAVLAALAMTAR
jgi:uncharacterized protein YndB with AHSA1/START domain